MLLHWVFCTAACAEHGARLQETVCMLSDDEVITCLVCTRKYIYHACIQF